jgi:hypothetical protein
MNCPLATIAIVSETNTAVGGGKSKDFDVLDRRYSYLGRRIRTDVATARAIVHAAAQLGLAEVLTDVGDKFKLRLLRWKEWHPKDPLAAEHKRRHRRLTRSENEPS